MGVTVTERTERSMRFVSTYAVILAASITWALASPLAAQGLPTPSTWKWVTDAPVEHQTALSPPEGKWLFGVMAPGWHITTRPGAVLYEPTYAGTGRFSVESETFLFPGTSQAGVGLLLGGRALDAADARYTAFVIRRDGSVAVQRREGGQTVTLADWARAKEVQPGQTGEPARNLLRVDVEAEVTRFLVNGAVVAEVRRPAAEFAGTVGLRIGADIDVHVTNLDVTLRLALPRSSQKTP
jgi:hypothetical protein